MHEIERNFTKVLDKSTDRMSRLAGRHFKKVTTPTYGAIVSHDYGWDM